jgi:hypothetical protein
MKYKFKKGDILLNLNENGIGKNFEVKEVWENVYLLKCIKLIKLAETNRKESLNKEKYYSIHSVEESCVLDSSYKLIELLENL